MKNRLHMTRRISHKRLRLALEPLESRRLLAGVNVFVYVDQNGSRAFEAGQEAPAVNRLVYVDLNQNARFDNSDGFAISDGLGVASFPDLPAGNYQIGLVNRNDAQVQTSPILADSIVAPSNALIDSTLVSDSDMGHVWAITPSGSVYPQGTNDSGRTAFELGGSLISVTSAAGGVAWAVIDQSQAGRKLLRLDLVSGEVETATLKGLARDDFLTGVVRSGDQLLLSLISQSNGRRLAAVETTGNVLDAAQFWRVPAGAVVGSPAANRVAVLQTSGSLSKIMQLGLTGESPTVESSLTTPAVSRLDYSQDGKLLFASGASGGVTVYASSSAGLVTVASLTEAAGPVNATAADGRFASANKADPAEMIFWDRNTWQPVSRTKLAGAATTNAGSAIGGFAVDSFGQSAMVSTSGGVYRVALARPDLVDVVASESGAVQAEIGVRLTRTPQALPARVQMSISTQEDSPARIDLSNGFNAASGSANALFKTVQLPKHGSVRVETTGESVYSPSENFFGGDVFVIEALDGYSSSWLTVTLDVSPVNDEPGNASTFFSPVSSNITPGTIIGVIDGNIDSSYSYHTDDERFEVVGGELVRTAFGQLSDETEPVIVVNITGTDISNPLITVSKTVGVAVTSSSAPSPTIHVDLVGVNENDLGAMVGFVSLIGEGVANDSDFVISDSRFEVEGGILKLKSVEALDYEAEPHVQLMIEYLAGGSGSSWTVVTLDVADLPDADFWLYVDGVDVESDVPGAIVGMVVVTSEQPGGEYYYSVSDSRFTVENDLLRLKDGVMLDEKLEPSVSVIVTASSAIGTTASNTVDITVTPRAVNVAPARDPLDIDGNGDVTPRDVLILINRINVQGPGPVIKGEPASGESEPAISNEDYDVNGDGFVTPLDILIIINHLNSDPPSHATGEGESETTVSRPPLYAELSAGTPAVDNPVDEGLSFAGDTDDVLACEPYSIFAAPPIERLVSVGINESDKSLLDDQLEHLLDELSRAHGN